MFGVSYRVVEKALLRTYNVPGKAQGAFRGRLGSLQKQGLFGPRNMPGRGIALPYGPDQFHRLVFACELLEFGIAPSVVLELVEARWERRLRAIFRDAEAAVSHDPGPADVILHMGGVSLLGNAFTDTVPNINSCPLHRLADQMTMWMRMSPDDPAGLPPRALVVNLSMRLRAFHAALAVEHDLKEPVEPLAVPPKQMRARK
jgi:hypothetical protein